MNAYIGLDIGGTKTLAVRIAPDGEVQQRIRRPTPQPLDAGLEMIHDMVARLVDGQTAGGIGVSIGGPIDREAGRVSPLHQPDWSDVPIKAILSTKFGLPVAIDVDAVCGALGERAFGGADCDRFLYLTVSTGMGGCLLIDGEPYRGAGGVHPEVGHQTIRFRCRYPERAVCACGASGCLESLVSGRGIERIYGVRAESAGDEIRQEIAGNLGEGLRNLATIYAPQLIVLAGGVALGLGPGLLESAGRIMREGVHLVVPPELRLSRLGEASAAIGAAVLVMEREAGRKNC